MKKALLAETGQDKVNGEAISFLRERMFFYKDKGEQIIAEIIERLNNDQNAKAEVLAAMYKEFANCEKLAADYAKAILPYQTPRLESIESKTEIKHRYVARLPERRATQDEWLKQVNQDIEFATKSKPDQKSEIN